MMKNTNDTSDTSDTLSQFQRDAYAIALETGALAGEDFETFCRYLQSELWHAHRYGSTPAEFVDDFVR